jgi:DNA/RNA-binding domain of Phe-tRNA-synthetase-like protein
VQTAEDAREIAVKKIDADRARPSVRHRSDAQAKSQAAGREATRLKEKAECAAWRKRMQQAQLRPARTS